MVSIDATARRSVSELLNHLYGQQHRLCTTPSGQVTLVLSRDREIDLIELEQLCDAVGWSRRPLRRVRRALQNSLLLVGLWRHDPRLPKLVGFARCTGDGVIDATIWDVAVHPCIRARVWANNSCTTCWTSCGNNRSSG